MGPQGAAGQNAPSGAIAGQLSHCAPNTNFTGYLVYIPGRAFSVFTGPNGAFQIDNVPAGTYTLAVEHSSGAFVVPNVAVGNALVTLPSPIEVGTCAPVCVPAVEVCNGIDDDCDGLIDNGNPGGGASCNTGLVGACSSGTSTCSNGALTCTPTVQPTVEACNGLDDDCDGVIDDGNPGGGLACNTGHVGVCAAGTSACTNGALTCQQSVQPNVEACNGLDDDCDGIVDDGNPGGGVACSTGMLGVCAAGARACMAGALVCFQSVQASAEVCDGLDNDCDGTIDEGVKITFYRDQDGDGYGNPNVTTQACGQPAGYVANNTDCNDNSLQAFPGAFEACDNVDNNCNGTIDEGVKLTFYRDADGDGFGNPSVSTQACSPPAGYGSSNSDCNDGNAAIRPGAVEVCDAIDNNCDGLINNGASCPNLANAFGACIANACGIGACNAGFDNCNGVISDGCERNLMTDTQHCGACGQVCGGGQVCTNGACSSMDNQWKQWQ